MRTKFDSSDFNDMVKDLKDGVEEAWLDAGKNFKEETPVRSGNARRKTRNNKQRIVADYAYSARLDDGYSKQAPNGMTDPTLDQFEKDINELVRKQ